MQTLKVRKSSNNWHLPKGQCQKTEWPRNILSVWCFGNDDSGGTEYLAGSGVTACGAIEVAAAYTNS